MSVVTSVVRLGGALVLAVSGALVAPPATAGAAPANPLTLKVSAGLTSASPAGKKIVVTRLHPGTLAMLTATVTNTGTEPLDTAEVRFRLPADGSLTYASLVGGPVDTVTCTATASAARCTATGLAPAEKRRIAIYVRVAGTPGGRSCVVAAASPDRATVPEVVTPRSCLTRVGWPQADRGTGFEVGDRAHDLELLDERGKVVRLSDYRGSYVQLDFSAGWCQPSMVQAEQDVAEIRALGDSLGAPVHLLTVLVESPAPGRQSTPTNAATWRAKFKPTTHVLATEGDDTLEALQQQLAYTPASSEVTAFPTNVFLTPKGRIFATRLGAGEPGDTTAIFQSAP